MVKLLKSDVLFGIVVCEEEEKMNPFFQGTRIKVEIEFYSFNLIQELVDTQALAKAIKKGDTIARRRTI